MLLSFGLLSGCEHDEYVVEITPKGDSFERKLTCWHVSTASTSDGQSESKINPLSEDKLKHLDQIYGEGKPAEGGKKTVFVKTFQAQTPADVGGSGTYTRYTSSLGDTVIYGERFRGDDDIAAQLARRNAAADQLVDLLIGWSQSEIGKEPDFAKLHDFLDKQLRQDLKNMAAYLWTSDVVSRTGENADSEFAARVLQYLHERRYLTATELPRLLRTLSNAEEQPEAVLSMIMRALARQMGVPEEEPVPECLAFLAKPDQVKASFEAYVRTTDLYKIEFEEWREDESREPNAEPPEPLDVVGELVFGQLFSIRFFVSPDKVQVRLACGTEPFETNGEWDADTDVLTWKHVLDKDRSLPAFSYAAWSQPNAELQKKRFGRLILTGQELAEYAIWYQGLSPTEAAVWDGFLAKCEPDEQLRERIEGFRFPNDPPLDPAKPDETPASLADAAKELILKGLEADR